MGAAVPERAVRTVEEYCASRVPEGLEDELRVEWSLRGAAITLAERRPPWNPEFGPEWSQVKVAQLRYDAEHETWSLYACGSNGRWFVHDHIGPTRDVAPLLNEIDRDPTGIFWG